MIRFSPFTLLCSAGLFAIFSSTISKSPVLPLFASHLGASPLGVGVIASISAFTGIAASIPAGMLSDKFGRKKMLIFSVLVFSTAPFMYLLVSSIWQLAAVRFYHGLATAIFIPVAMALVSDLFHTTRGEKISLFSTSTLIGRFMAPIAGGSIIGAMVFDEKLSYKTVYLVCGIAGIIALIFALKLPGMDGDRMKRQTWEEAFTAFKKLISNRVILITSTVEAAILFAYGTFETFLPLYSIKNGLSAYEVGILLSAQVVVLALTKPLMGRFSDRHGREPQIFTGAVIGAVCIGSFSMFKSFAPLFILSILFGLSLSIVTSATSAFVADLSKRETHGSAMGVLGSIMDIGHTTGPLFSGIVATYFGFGNAFIAVSLVLVIVAFLFFATLQTLNS